MPLINRIEVSNFMNATRREPWQPTWPHQIFELMGLNSVINMPNGRGKTTIVTTILCCLAGMGKKISETRAIHFAPKITGRFTHLRVQMTMDTDSGAAFDIFSDAPQGQQMVFGIYGRSGEGESYNLYAYQGTFENCPIHRDSLDKRGHLELITDKDFVDNLQNMPGRFPANAREKTNELWRDYVSKWFDMVGIEQQINYQLKAGGEGKAAYFEVKPRVGMKYSTAVFYEHLAPQLLTNVMGDYGEEDEHGIEDTIHEKARKVVHAKVFSEKRRRQLIQTQRILNELQRVNTAAEEIAKSSAARQELLVTFGIEMAVLRNLVVDKPIPGLPSRPPADIPVVTNYLVLCDGIPYLPDRAFEMFTGEDPRRINERAVRNFIKPVDVEKSQLLEIACDNDFSSLERKHTGGPANKFYDINGATDLLNTEKILPEWDMEKAVTAIRSAFEWAAANADTNPARFQRNTIDQERSLKTAERDSLSDTIGKLSNEKTSLLEEQQQIGEQQAEYRRMHSSGLFTSDELDAPAETGSAVAKELTIAKDALSTHDQKVAKQETVYADWQTFNAEFGDSATPKDVLDRLQETEKVTRSAYEEQKKKHEELRSITKTLKSAALAAREKRDLIVARVTEAVANAPLAQMFSELFPRESPLNLDRKVLDDRDAARKDKARLENELARLVNVIKDLAEFQGRFGKDRDPAAWLSKRTMIYEIALTRHQLLEAKLKEATISLDNLERFSIAPNSYVRAVTEKIKVPSIPLYQSVEQMGLNSDRKATVLTLFSGVLNAPVLSDAALAAIAARNLADNGLEFPVFVQEDFIEFCHSRSISFDANLARSLFVGVRTRAVDCLLDPALVDREKEKMQFEIKRFKSRLALLDKTKKRLAAETYNAKLAGRAQYALETGAVDKDADLRCNLEAISESLVTLEMRASEDALESIRGVLRYQKALCGQSIVELIAERETLEQEYSIAEAVEQTNADTIEDLTQELAKSAELLREASVARSTQGPVIKRIIDFLSDTDYGLSFMMAAVENRTKLTDNVDKASRRNVFRFDIAQRFVASGLDRPLEIEKRLSEITSQISDIENQKKVIAEKVNLLEKAHGELIPQVFKIDNLSQKIVKLYRKHRHLELACEAQSIDKHPIYLGASFIRAYTSENELIARLCRLNDEIDDFSEHISECFSNLAKAENAYNSASGHFNSELDRVARDTSLEMSEHLRHLLEQSKTDPVHINFILAATQSDYDKDKVANETARQQLDLEWESMAGWLAEFTQRLPTYFKLMKNVFAPQYDNLSAQVTHAGFVISGEVMQSDDVQAVMGDIVSDIEDYEKNQRKSSDSDSRKESGKSFRREIRNKFYQRILSNPTIKVCIPSISEKPLMLEKEMASSGQGVAMTLLWIVKMADFVSERERQRKTVSGSRYDARAMVNIKKIRNIDSQFVFIDGAFSHLSDRALIEDALKGISRTHGRFQLIVTGHDPDYNFKHNFKYFPTLLTGREISDRYMYVENGKPVDPDVKGSHFGAMDLLRLHKIADNPSSGVTI